MQWRAATAVAAGKGRQAATLASRTGERRRQQRKIARRVAAGEPIAALAEEYGAQPQTIVRWASLQPTGGGGGSEARE